jgi:hypothetical protein
LTLESAEKGDFRTMRAQAAGCGPGYGGDFPKDRVDASLRWHDGV